MDNNNIQISNWFLDQLAVYQTANSDYQSVKNNFIIRKVEYQIIIDAILNKKNSDPLQHELILGRRGSGKSTLLKRIEIEIVENPKLNIKFIAINLAEEQAGIYRLFDLWAQVIDELVKQHDAIIKIPVYKSFENDQAYTRQLYQLIHDYCTINKKKIILLLDNFDRIVENFTDDGNLLRETLINYSDVQIIAGSTRMDEHFWRYDMPFYDFFRTHKLEVLSKEEMNTLLTHWSNLLNIASLKEFVKNNPGKIENIRILTDGLPRTLQFFIQIVLQKSETSTYDYLKKTMDNVSPLYQERLSSLTAQLRKIVYEMAFIWEACTTKQLVENAKMESKLISANLKTLVEKGIVDKIETNKKQHLYRISERFFNMWLIITQGNPDQKRKAKWLTIFLENWYNANDFKRLAKEHIENLRNGNADWNTALLHSKGLSQSKYITTEDRDAIINLTENIKGKGIENCLIELPEKFVSILDKIIKYQDEKEYEKAIELTERIENEEDGFKFHILASLYLNQQKYTEAESYYLQAINKGQIEALNNLAILYSDQQKYNKAESYYLKAVDKGHIDALFNLAVLYKDQLKYNEAESYYLQAIDKGYINALNNLAVLYKDQLKYNEAESYYLKAVDKGHIDALNNLAVLYSNKQKYNEAENYYLKAIDKGHTDALFNLAVLYSNQQKYTEAENYYLKAIDKGRIEPLYNLANLYNDQQKYNEAENYYLKAIDKGHTDALFNLAILYIDQQKYTKAENYYLQAIDKNNINALYNLAILYYKINKNKQQALALIERANKTESDTTTKETKLIIEIWNGIFNDVEKRAIALLKSNDNEVTYELMIDLLVQQQKNIVLNLFNHAELGIELQEKNIVLYYATLILNNVQDDNLLLKIPPELNNTLNEVLLKIETQQKMYGYL
jgi:TPR repeat protein/ribosomal protein S25